MSMLPWMVMAAGAVAADYTSPINPQPLCAATAPQHHFRIQFENDAACGEDKNYTHGTRIDYVRGTSCNEWSYGVSLMQNIYTPERHTRWNNPGEHPYAGCLLAGVGAIYSTDAFSNTVELQLGASGRASLAKECQNNLHSACGMETWDGWDHQVPTELLFQVSAHQDFNLFDTDSGLGGLQSDGMFFTHEDGGNVRIAGGVGAAFRCGINLPSNNYVIGNAPGRYGVGLQRENQYDPTSVSYYLLAQGSVDYVARDFSIDGGMFHHFDQPCSRRPWQAQATLGLGVARKGIDYFAGVVYNSRTYRSQDTNDMYGTFSIMWNW